MNQFKRAQVILKNSFSSKIYKEDNGLLYIDEVLKTYGGVDHFHLYIISDDKIEEDDYFLWYSSVREEYEIYQYNYDVGYGIQTKNVFGDGCLIVNHSGNCGKIIVTTDTSLNYIEHDDTVPYPKGKQIRLPQPSQQFIEKYIEEYNKGNIITDVLVEYEEGLNKPLHEALRDSSPLVFERLKINSKDNTITIKKLKDSWNREEVIEQMWLAYKSADTIFDDEKALRIQFDKWVKENL